MPPAASGRSHLNLGREPEVHRFALGVLSALAFLERKGWPFGPSPEEWFIDEEGLPYLSRPPEAPVLEHPVAAHAALLYRLLAGRPAPRSGPWPTLPRRVKSFALWNAWLASARSHGTPEGPSLQDLLSDLWTLGGDALPRSELPADWGIGADWEPPDADWPLGYSEIRGRSVRSLEGFLSHLCTLPEGPSLTPVFLGTTPPYPFAALEPFVASCLGSVAEARSWLGARLRRDGGSISSGLRQLVEARDEAGWALWPGRSLDPDSSRALKEAASAIPKRFVVLDEGEEASAGGVTGVHLLWLPKTAETWYLDHCRALFGPDPESLLAALADLPPGQPRPGSPLLPSTRHALAAPRTNRLGRPDGSETQGLAPAATEELPVAARRGDLAPLLLGARRLCGEGSEDDGPFWEGETFLLLGQAKLALAVWEKCRPRRGMEGRLEVHRARAYEKLQAYDRALQCLRAAEKLGASGPDRDVALLLKGQLLWVSGRMEEAQAILSDLASASADPDVRSQASCHLATAALHSGQVERALELLEAARSLAPKDPEPLTRFLLLHRLGLAYRKMGEFARALELFQASADLASCFAFRLLEAGCLGDCGNALRRLSRFEEARSCFLRCVEGAEALGNEKLGESARFNLAVCQLEGGEPRAAKRVFEQAVTAGRGSGNPLYAAYDCYWLAFACRQLGEFPQALEWAEKGIGLMGGVRDLEAYISLLTLRGELLLLTGQGRKLAFLLKELDALRSQPHEPDDRLAALALRCAAARSGTGTFGPQDWREAESLLPLCSPQDRASWLLQSARDGAGLARAWEEAKIARNPHLACRALVALAEMRAFPALAPAERRWLARYLESNSVHGPERSLLPMLAEPPPAAAEPLQIAAPIAVLAAAESHPEETQEQILRLTGAKAGCLLRPGEPPHFWGESLADERRSLLEAAGLKGELPVRGGVLLALPGRGGLWCGLYKAGSRRFAADESVLASLWARLLPPSRAVADLPMITPHPALARHVLTRSPAMAPVLESLQRAAAFHFPVLLTGEPGVGKEACASALHSASSRAAKRWVPANCANLTPTLAASLLFGHRRGSFTGADRDQTGLVEAARGSTLFLDEVGELPLEVQAHLLRFIQDGSFLPLGEVRPRDSDARIVAATNRNLEKATNEGRFREDLFHRLNVIRIEVPPLRERPEDIPFLFDHFLGQVFALEGLEPPSIDPSVHACLTGYRWPGNVRELQNAAKAAMVAAHPGRSIRVQHLPPALLRPGVRGDGGATLEGRLRDAERSIIEESVREAGGNFSAAARALGLSRQGLFAKMKRLGMR